MNRSFHIIPNIGSPRTSLKQGTYDNIQASPSVPSSIKKYQRMSSQTTSHSPQNLSPTTKITSNSSNKPPHPRSSLIKEHTLNNSKTSLQSFQKAVGVGSSSPAAATFAHPSGADTSGPVGNLASVRNTSKQSFLSMEDTENIIQTMNKTIAQDKNYQKLNEKCGLNNASIDMVDERESLLDEQNQKT